MEDLERWLPIPTLIKMADKALKYTIVSSYMSIKQALCKWIYSPTQSFGSKRPKQNPNFYRQFPTFSCNFRGLKIFADGLRRFCAIRPSVYRLPTCQFVTKYLEIPCARPSRTELKLVRPRKYSGIYRPPNRTIEVPCGAVPSRMDCQSG